MTLDAEGSILRVKFVVLGEQQMNLENSSIPPNDVSLLQSVLDAWCHHQKICRKDATEEAKILISEYQRGVRSQLQLIDALSKHQ